MDLVVDPNAQTLVLLVDRSDGLDVCNDLRMRADVVSPTLRRQLWKVIKTGAYEKGGCIGINVDVDVKDRLSLVGEEVVLGMELVRGLDGEWIEMSWNIALPERRMVVVGQRVVVARRVERRETGTGSSARQVGHEAAGRECVGLNVDPQP